MKEISSLRKAVALLLMVMLGQVAATAAPKFYISDFSIAAGEQKEIAINLDMDAIDVKQIEGYIEMPTGLTIVDNGYGTNARVKVDDTRTAGFLAQYAPDTKLFKMMSMGPTVQGAEGPVAYVKVKAATNLAATTTITLRDFKVKHVDGTYEDATTENATVTCTGNGSSNPDDPTALSYAISFATPSISINAGETKDVEIQMTNNGNFTGIQGTFVASTGVSVKSVAVSSRLSPVVNNFDATTGTYMFFGNISGNEGTVFTVTVEAAADYSGVATINFKDIVATTPAAERYTTSDITLSINVLDSSTAGDANTVFSFNPTEIVLIPGQTTEVAVNMTNEASGLMGFNATLLLPAGVTAELTRSDRIGGNIFNYNTATGYILYYGGITGNDGTLFTIKLTADDTFEADAQLQLSNIVVTNSSAQRITPASINMTLKALDKVAKAQADAIISELQKKLDDTKAAIDETTIAAFEATINSIQTKINTLTENVGNAYLAGTLNVADVTTEANAIGQEIDQLKTNADKYKANADAFKKLTDEIAALQAALDAIEIKAEDMLEADFATLSATKTSIQNAINNLTSWLAEQNSNTALTAESVLPVNTVAADTEKLANDLAAAKAAKEAAAAEAAALEAANQELAWLKNAATALTISDEVKASDNEDVKAAVAAAEEAIAAANDAIAAVEAKIAEGKLATDNKEALATAITAAEDAISAALNAIVLAEEAYANVPTVVPGDITGSGEVDADDLLQFQEDFLSGNYPKKGEDNFDLYDVNGDGKINIADMIAIQNLSLGLNIDGSDPADASRSAEEFEAGTLNVLTTMMSNGNTRLDIVLESTADYRAFQMDIVLPEATRIVAENASGLAIRSNDLSNTHRVIGFGDMQNGTIVSFEVEGNGQVQFKDVVLATNSARAIDFNMGSITGINAVANAQSAIENSYDLSGKMISGQKKGLNIIRSKNGSTKKVLVK